MDLCITTSKEIIKPSSPTPKHKRTHALSLLDQLNPDVYFSVILFYSRNSTNAKSASHHLKKSLSETLTLFYPFAGRVKDNLFVDCDDHGVPFIETQVAGDISPVIQKQPDENILQQLIPCKPQETTVLGHNLLVQVNFFGCGGMAIGLCFQHKIADAATAANFVKSWGILAHGDGAPGAAKDYNDHVVYDINSIFPAQDLFSNITLNTNVASGFFTLDSVVKRFTFDGDKIAVLREKLFNSNESILERPSRVVAVSSVILGALLAAYRGSDDDDDIPTTVTVIFAVNLRKRMNPPLAEQSFGNICSSELFNLTTADCDDDDNNSNHGGLAGKLQESIRTVDEQFVRKLYGEGQILNVLKDFSDRGDQIQGAGLSDKKKKKKCNHNNNKVFVISSWCKMPFYEVDFGWGTPNCIGIGERYAEAAVLVDSSDGDGIEAWVGLSRQDMSRFEQHAGITAYASCRGLNI